MSEEGGKDSEVAAMEEIVSPVEQEMSVPVDGKSTAHNEDHNFTESASPSHKTSTQPEYSTSRTIARRVWKSGKVLNMSGIEEADLPFDIKLQILKEYLRLWANGFSESGGPSFSTNRAQMALHHLGYYISYDHLSEHDLLWNIPGQDVTGQEIFENELLSNDNLRKNSRVHRILSIGENCEAFRVPLERFFYGHMLWQFCDSDIFKELGASESMGSPWSDFNLKYRIPQHIPDYIRHLSLYNDDSWRFFVNLLETVYSSATQAGRFPGLKSLEIFVSRPDAPDWNLFPKFGNKDHGGGYEPESLNPQTVGLVNIRVRYLVTRCYQSIKARPGATIIIRTGLDRSDRNKEEMARYYQLYTAEIAQFCRYSQKDAEEFYNGTSKLLRGLHSIEFDDVAQAGDFEGFYLHLRLYWQMLFASEWRKIWEQGMELAEDEGGYSAVTEPPRAARHRH